MLVDEGSWLEVARYVHLNPVRVASLRLGKSDRLRQRPGAVRDPGASLARKRLSCLRRYRWSSYRDYVGLASMPGWIAASRLTELTGAIGEAAVRRALRLYHEEALLERRLEPVWDRLVAGAVLGSAEFVEQIKSLSRGLSKEVSRSGCWTERIPWVRIVGAVEAEHGGRWAEFRDAHGDWGRDVALYVGRRQGRMTLGELAERAGGLGIAATGQAVSRVGRGVRGDGVMARRVRAVESRLWKRERG